MPIIIFSIFLPLLLVYLLQKNKKPANTLIPPGPPGLPLIGNLHQFATAGPAHLYLSQLSKKYGPLMQMKLGSVPVLIISSATLAKEVLKTQDLAFCSRPKLRGLQTMSYNGADIVFAPYNEYWRELRKVTTIHLFNLKKIQSFRPIREDEIIHRMVSRIASSCDQVVNLSEMATALSSTLIARVVLGKRYEEQRLEMRRFDQQLHDAQASAVTFFVSDYFPWFSWVDKLIGSADRLEVTFKKLDSFLQKLIDEHLDPNRVKNVDNDDGGILDVLINLKEQDLCSFDLTWDHIKGLLMDIFVAATDTTSASIIWTMTLLMKTPHVMKKLQREIRELIGQNGNIDEDDLIKLPFLKAVIYESWRLYPPAPLLVPRETLERCTLEGYEIQPQTLVYVNAWAIARDPMVWERSDEFLPDRFFNSNIDVSGKDYGVIPFGSGRRICPGMFMGQTNVELIIANLVYAFDWELPEGVQVQDIDDDVLSGITVHKKNPLYIVPKKYVV